MSIWTEVQDLNAVIDAAYADVARDFKITVIEMHVVLSLYQQDGQRASSLSRACGRKPTSFTPVLDRMVAKGLVRREAHATDRRAVRICLTDKARSMKVRLLTRTDALEQDQRQAVAAWLSRPKLHLPVMEPAL